MKFAQVPVGQRFELEGTRYLKTSPVVAVEEASGRSRFLGKYVEVALVQGADAPASRGAAPAVLEAPAALAELDAFHDRCLAILVALKDAIGAQAFERARAELEEARRQAGRRLAGGE